YDCHEPHSPSILSLPEIQTASSICLAPAHHRWEAGPLVGISDAGTGSLRSHCQTPCPRASRSIGSTGVVAAQTPPIAGVEGTNAVQVSGAHEGFSPMI